MSSFVLVRFFNIKSLLIKQQQVFGDYKHVSEIKYLNLEDKYLAHFIQKNDEIPPSLILYNSKSESILFEKIIKKKKIILFFPSSACTSCFDSKVLDYIISKIGIHNFIIISTVDQYKNRLNELKFNGPKPEILSLKDDCAKYFSNVDYLPTICIIEGNDFKPKYHIIFDKNNTKMIEKYIDVVKEKYFKE